MIATRHLAHPPRQQAATRSLLALLFADLCGSTALAASLEAEHYLDIVHQLHRAYRDIVVRHGGTVVRLQGDGLLAMFGHPDTPQAMGRRGAQAACELHAAVRSLRPGWLPVQHLPLRLHSGLHAGVVLLSEGDDTQGRYDLVGQATNIAARLSHLASPDEILVSEGTLGPDRAHFYTGPPRALRLPGVAEPVIAWPLLSGAGDMPWPTAGEAARQRTLLGREPELAQAQAALRQVQAGRATSLAFAAAPGQGKTRLAEEVVRRAAEAGCQVHRGHCGDGGDGGDGGNAGNGSVGARPLQPFGQVLQALFGVTGETPEAHAAAQVEHSLLALGLGEQAPALSQRLRWVMAGGDPLRCTPQRTSLAQACASALQTLFDALTRQRPQVLLLDDWQAADDASHRALSALYQLQERPLLVLLTTRDVDGAAPPAAQTLWLQPLTPADRQALPGRVAQAPPQRRQAAPNEDHGEALARHLHAAGWAAPAAEHAEVAGDKALAASALDRACAQYGAALAALDRCPDTPQRARRWIDIARRLGAAGLSNPSPDALPWLARAVALAETLGDLPALAQAIDWLARLHDALGNGRQAERLALQALEAAAAAGDDRLVRRGRATLGQARAATAQYGAAHDLLDEAIATAGPRQGGGDRGQPAQDAAQEQARLLAAKGAVLGDRGDFDHAHACFDEALDAAGDVACDARQEVQAAVHGQRATVLLWQGRWEAAHASAMLAAITAEEVRSLYACGMGRAAAAYARWRLQGDPGALAGLRQASGGLAARGILRATSLHHGWLSEVLARSGDATQSRLHAAHALRRARQHDLLGGAMASRAMARLAAQAGDAARAAHWAARARAIALRRDSAHEHAVNLLCEAEAAALLRQGPRAAALADAALGRLAALGMAWHQAQASRLLQPP